MRLADAYPYYFLDACPADDLPWIAVNDLHAGSGGDAVAQLAGMSNPARRDIDDILPHALRELGIEPTTPEEAWRGLARGYLDDIISGQLTPSDGAYQLFLLCRYREFVSSEEEEKYELVTDIGMLYGSVVDDEDAAPQDRAWATNAIIQAACELRPLLD